MLLDVVASEVTSVHTTSVSGKSKLVTLNIKIKNRHTYSRSTVELFHKGSMGIV